MLELLLGLLSVLADEQLVIFDHLVAGGDRCLVGIDRISEFRKHFLQVFLVVGQRCESERTVLRIDVVDNAVSDRFHVFGRRAADG